MSLQHRHDYPAALRHGLLATHPFVGLFGKNMRFIRICGSERLETPESWTLAGERVGISDGLWCRADGAGTTANTRVYYRTVDEPATHTAVGIDLAKLTSQFKEDQKQTAGNDRQASPAEGEETREDARNYLDPSKNAWNAELLEFVVVARPADEDPATWAGFLHQQRHCFDDYRAALGRPLIMHLARLANEYASPAADTTEDDGRDLDEQPEPESDTQPEIDLDI